MGRASAGFRICESESGDPSPRSRNMTNHYDAIVIGTGQAGPYLAARLAGDGKKVAVIERNRFGGTCVNTGCIPTKTLVASAHAAHLAHRAANFGVALECAVKVDMKRVKARMDSVSGKSRTSVETWMKGLANCTVYEEHARFESAHGVRAGRQAKLRPLTTRCQVLREVSIWRKDAARRLQKLMKQASAVYVNWTETRS